MALVSRFLISSDSDNPDAGCDNDGWVVTMLGILTVLVTRVPVLLLTITELLFTATHGTEVVTTAVTADTAGDGDWGCAAAGACKQILQPMRCGEMF